MKKILALCCLLLTAACTDPVTRTGTTDDPPTLAFTGANTTAAIYLNGIHVGLANDFNGDPKTLIVPRGTHMLEIHDGGTVVYSQKIFVSDGAVKTIKLSGLK